MTTDAPDIILHRGVFTTLDRANPQASAVAIKGGRFVRVGSDAESGGVRVLRDRHPIERLRAHRRSDELPHLDRCRHAISRRGTSSLPSTPNIGPTNRRARTGHHVRSIVRVRC